MRSLLVLVLFSCLAVLAWTPSRAATLAAGSDHTCALTELERVVCWGDNASQQLGLDPGTTPFSRGPGDAVPLLESAVALVSGNAFSCALLTPSGHVSCWGANNAGQSGTGVVSPSVAPALVLAPGTSTPLVNAVRLSAGESHACASLGDGKAVCWGANDAMQLGNDVAGNTSVPTYVRAPAGAGDLAGVTNIAAGASHTCAISTASGVVCWGDNSSGQLGNNNRPVNSALPVAAINLGEALALTAGRSHTCALSADGGVHCWGRNEAGQLGIGSAAQYKEVPAVVRNASNTAALANVSALAQGSGVTSHTCAISDLAGEVYCWGEGEYAQLGNGDTSNRLLPTPVAGLGAMSPEELSLGERHSCAREGLGDIRCWGDNATGSIGNGAPVARATPVSVQLPNDSHAARVSVGGSTGSAAHACATTNAGEVYCWGDNISGQLGNGDDEVRPIATPGVVAFAGPNYPAAAIAAGGQHTCAMRSAGQIYGLWCWGNGLFGQLGAGAQGPFLEPQQPILGVTSPLQASHLTSGAFHSCILDGVSGEAWCWGAGTHGRLGNGSTSNQNTPVKVLNPAGNGNLQNLVGISAGEAHTCARRLIGLAYCWGRGINGELGNAQAANTSLPQVVVGPGGASFLSPVEDIRAGRAHSCAIADGIVYCWGSNAKGQLGTGAASVSPSYTPLLSIMPAGMAPTRLAVGADHACAAMRELATGRYRIYCWGANESGQLGDGTYEQRATPVEVSGLPDSFNAANPVVDLAAGHGGTCVAFQSGQAWCWGDNRGGSLGNGEGPKYYVPEPVNSVEIDDVTRSEGADGGATTQFTFTVRRQVARDPASVKFNLLHDGTDAADFDFSIHPAHGSLDFPPDVFERQIVVDVINDNLAEADEQFLIELSDSSIGMASLAEVGIGTITDEDIEPPTYSLSAVSGCDANEGPVGTAHNVRLRVTGSSPVPVGQTYQIKWSLPLAGGSTADAADFSAVSLMGTVTLNQGDTFKEFDLTVLGEGVVEGDEAFVVSLVDAGGAIASVDSDSVDCVIRNDDAWISVEPHAGATALEGADGTDRLARFRVSLSEALPDAVTLTYDAEGLLQGATKGVDFSAPQSQTLSIPAGVTQGLIEIVVHGDDDQEDDEAFTVALNTVTSGNGMTDAAADSAPGLIVDDDDLQQVNFTIAALATSDQPEGDAGTRDFSFEVARSGTGPATIRVRVLSGLGADAATIEEDFLPLGTPAEPLALHFVNGESKTILVKVSGDTLPESDEDFRVELFDPSTGASVAVGMAEGRIRDDDADNLFSHGFED